MTPGMLSLLPEMKLRGGGGKFLLRRTVRPWLPEGILDRPKQGFAVPLSQWFRGGLSSLAPDWLDRSGIYAIGETL